MPVPEEREILTAMNYAIAMDYDDTLFIDSYPGDGKPNWPVIFQAMRMKEAGVKLILWTCREADALDEAVEKCRKLGLDFDAVNDNVDFSKEWNDKHRTKGGAMYAQKKVFADLYIDDKSPGSIEYFLSLDPERLVPKDDGR